MSAAITAEPTVRQPARFDVVDRRVGLLISIIAAFLLVIALPQIRFGGGDTALVNAWDLAGIVLACAVVAAAAGGALLPARTLQALWILIPLLALLLLASWPAVRQSPDTMTPWVWTLQTACVGYAAVALRWTTAIAYAVLAAVVLPIAYLVVDGSVSGVVGTETLIHLGNVVFVPIFIAIDRALAALWDSERAHAIRAASLARAEAARREQDRVATIVHDEVLATLTAAMNTTGAVPSELRAQARQAASVIAAPARTSAVTTVTAKELVRRLRLLVDGRSTGIAFSATAGGPDVPTEVADAIEAALDEAVRNSLRHAADPFVAVARKVTVTVTDHVEVEIVDNGRGFDPDAVPPTRLGIRQSIRGRMSTVDGGASAVISSPGSGTAVRIWWAVR